MTSKHVPVSVRLPRDLVRQVDQTAERESRNRSQQITFALRDWLAAADAQTNKEYRPSADPR
jgi:metal-responsive CopG/Arc/MetJ family transcriptional regulator